MFYKTVYSSKKISTFQVFSMNFIHKAEPSIIKSLFLVTIRFCHHLTNLSSYHLTAKHHFLTHPTFLIVPCNIYRSKIYCKWTSLFDRAYRANLRPEKVIYLTGDQWPLSWHTASAWSWFPGPPVMTRGQLLFANN